MNKTILITLLLALSGHGFSQEDTFAFEWKEKMSYPIGEDEVWSVDVLENFYVSDRGLINKYDSLGTLRFSQSIKSFGRMTQLVPVSTMKLIHFSEEQQTLCYFDNTLTNIDDCIDLSDEDIENATLVCASNQPNKVWILDNLNSRLILLSLKNAEQRQELKNLRGVLNIEEVTQILQRSTRLFLLDPLKGVYVFDMYGTLLEFIPQESIQQLDANEHTLFTLTKDNMRIYSIKSGESTTLKLPIDGVLEFSYQNRCFFFRTATDVHKYELQISE
ncbi:MAG: hypothetical protein QNK23_06860 [Crocinitomicaceae bacterium]|nr:hypothetical protein [Crocinitomicaceae bacterium]